MDRSRLGLFVLCGLFCFLPLGMSAAEPATPDNHLTIATRHAPPFSYQDDRGAWRGLAITLLDQIAERIGITYTLVDQGRGSLIDPVADGTVDAAIAAITITPEREQRVDFSHAYHVTGLGIATAATGQGGVHWWLVLRSLVSPEFLGVVASLSLLLLVIGFLIWLAERRHNPDFGGTLLQGLGNGFWFSAVTMTTVGYGDKSPKTMTGRLVALVWMFSALILIASFTAQLTSSLTLSAFSGPISGPQDLPGVRVGVMAGTTAESYATARKLRTTTYPTLAEAVQAAADGEVDAVVHDRPVLMYQVRQHHRSQLSVLDVVFERQDYGIALPLGSERRKAINQVLIDVVTSRAWAQDIEAAGLR